jgi:hypothetical protein
MYRIVKCGECSHSFTALLPDVTPEDAKQLHATDDDRRIEVTCQNPKCKKTVYLLKWSLPDLPLPP